VFHPGSWRTFGASIVVAGAALCVPFASVFDSNQFRWATTLGISFSLSVIWIPVLIHGRNAYPDKYLRILIGLPFVVWWPVMFVFYVLYLAGCLWGSDCL
jgi:hypothetical protein